MYRKTYLEINLDNIKSNVQEVINKYNDYDYYIGVVKANAYGHGEYIVNTLIETGINYLAVSSLEEAKDIRKYNKNIPILCLQPIDLDAIIDAVTYNVTITITSLEYLKALIDLEINKNLKVHLKVDSGLNRLGFTDKKELSEAFNILIKSKELKLEGIFSHFATTGFNDKLWDKQLETFKDITSTINLKKIRIIHMFCSTALLSHKKIDFCNGVRIGTLLYGYNISIKLGNSVKDIIRKKYHMYLVKKYNISETIQNVNIPLKPALSLYTEIIQIKDIKKGESVGYGALYKAKENITIAILPIGYADGVGRINNKRYVYINNKKYDIIGEIGMCMTCIKIDKSVKIDDAVMLMGKNISLGVFSRFNKKTIHETLTTLGKSLPRVYTKNNKVIYLEEQK